MSGFTPVASLAGGLVIGLAAAALLVAGGRIAGVSGIVGGLLTRARGDAAWRLAFVAGMLAGGVILVLAHPRAFDATLPRSVPVLAVAGLLVGYGTRLGGGCTSGHGVCGIGRMSARSLVATGAFMVVAAVVAHLATHVIGSWS